MFYDVPITIAAGTTKEDPQRETIKVTKGVIHRMEVEFPLGCRGYVHCKLKHVAGGHWPTNPDGYFRTDGYTISWDEYYEVKTEPFDIEIIGWSPDASYNHTLNIRIGMLESKFALLFINTFKALNKFLRLVGIRV